MNHFEIKADVSETQWEAFLKQIPHTPFTQSFAWGQFQKELGKQIWRIGVSADSELVAVLLLTKEKTKLGNFLYCVDGPAAKNWEFLPELKTYLSELAQTENCFFVRLDPRIEDNDQNRELFKKMSFVSSKALFQVKYGWVIDLNQTEEELLYQMRKTTRYEVRSAEKEGVRIEFSEDLARVSEFAQLLASTAGRKGFQGYNMDYLKTQFALLQPRNGVKLLFAYSGERLRAAGYFIFYGDTVTYLYGASDNSGDKSSASYLLQWSAILEAKRRGFKYYDFWGVVKDQDSKHPWYGISLFKKGFGGELLPYLNSQDLPLSRKYHFLRGTENLRRVKNKLRSGYWEI